MKWSSIYSNDFINLEEGSLVICMKEINLYDNVYDDHIRLLSSVFLDSNVYDSLSATLKRYDKRICGKEPSISLFV